MLRHDVKVRAGYNQKTEVSVQLSGVYVGDFVST